MFSHPYTSDLLHYNLTDKGNASYFWLGRCQTHTLSQWRVEIICSISATSLPNWDGGARTHGLLINSQTLPPTELHPKISATLERPGSGSPQHFVS